MFLPANLPWRVSIYLCTNYQSRPTHHRLASLTIHAHCYSIILPAWETQGELTIWRVIGTGSAPTLVARLCRYYLNKLLLLLSSVSIDHSTSCWYFCPNITARLAKHCRFLTTPYIPTLFGKDVNQWYLFRIKLFFYMLAINSK